MAEDKPQRSDETLLVHDERHSEGAVAPPIYQTSLFTFDSYAAMVDRMDQSLGRLLAALKKYLKGYAT